MRTRSSVLFNGDLKVDLPPDTYMHVLKYGLNLGSLRYLLVTHSHEDHFYVDELRMRKHPFAHIEKRRPLEVYGNSAVCNRVFKAVAGTDVVKAYVVKPFKPFKVGDYEVLPLQANHSMDEECLVYLVSLGDSVVFYGHDSGWYPDGTWRALKRRRLSLAILDCTCGAEDCSRFHMGIDCILRVKRRMLNEGIADGNTIFVATHFSHNGKLLHWELEERLKPHGILPAYDGLKLEV